VKRAIVGAFALAIVVVLAPRSGAQIVTIPLPTTTTTRPSPPGTAPGTTSTTAAEMTSSSEVETETTVAPVDTIPPVVDTSAPAITPVTPTATTLPVRRAPARSVALPVGIKAASVTGAYGIGFAGVLAVALALVALTTVTRSRLLPGGTTMNPRRRARLLAGIGCLVLAAVVGLVGYLKLSLEPDVNRQIPYLASAGMALVLLSAVGGAFLVGEQMRTDEERIEELEAAVEQLAALVGPAVEAAPRTRKRTGRAN
jgi:hypothetical protein